MSGYAIYRRAAARALGEGLYSAFKSLNVSDTDFRGGIQKEFGLKAGQSFTDPVTKNRYRVVRARGTVTGEGYILKAYMQAAARFGNLTANCTKAVLETDDTFVAHDLAGGYVFITAGTGVNQLRQIVDNDDTAAASTITVAERDNSYPGSQTAVDNPDALATQPDATSDYSVYCPWEVVQTGTSGADLVCAVALGAVTADYWTIVLEEGFGLVRCNTGAANAHNVAAGGLIAPSTTAGEAWGFTVAGITAADAAYAFGQGMDAYTGAAANRFCQIFGRFPVAPSRDY